MLYAAMRYRRPPPLRAIVSTDAIRPIHPYPDGFQHTHRPTRKRRANVGHGTRRKLTTHPPCGSGVAGPEGRRLSHRVGLEPQNQAAIAATSFNTGQTAPRDALKSI